ncbi:hypothetical protein ACA910_016781 [Epithemia clementina (nom. ined.)]
MGSKRKTNETEEERKERKRLKKEAKKKTREEPKRPAAQDDDETLVGTSNLEPHVVPVVSRLLHKEKLSMTVSLLPGNLGFVEANVEDAMRGFLLKYSAGFKGILLAFEDLEIRNIGKGRILGELPHIHYDIECSALVFKPSVGADLDGMIVESFDSHVSMIVHDYFNASITAHHLQNSGFQYDQTEGEWVHSTSNNRLAKGALLGFTIERVHESGGIISIDGSDPQTRSVGA